MRGLNSDLYSDRGNLSAKLIADVYGVSMLDMQQIIGITLPVPDAIELHDRLCPFEVIGLLRLVNPEFKQWLRTPNDFMQGSTPLECVFRGKVREVAGFVMDALTGQPT